MAGAALMVLSVPLHSTSGSIATVTGALRGIRTSRTSGRPSSLGLSRSDDSAESDGVIGTRTVEVWCDPGWSLSKSIGLNRDSLLVLFSSGDCEDVRSEGDGVIPQSLRCGSSAGAGLCSCCCWWVDLSCGTGTV